MNSLPIVLAVPTTNLRTCDCSEAMISAISTIEARISPSTERISPFVIPDTDYRGARAYPNSSCMGDKVQGNGMVTSVQMVLGFEKNLNNKKIGMPMTSYSADKKFMNAEIFVAANQPITFRFLKPQTIIKNGVAVKNNDETIWALNSRPKDAGYEPFNLHSTALTSYLSSPQFFAQLFFLFLGEVSGFVCDCR